MTICRRFPYMAWTDPLPPEPPQRQQTQEAPRRPAPYPPEPEGGKNTRRWAQDGGFLSKRGYSQIPNGWMGYFMENPKPYLNYLILYKWMIWVYPWIGNLRMFRSETHHHIWICTPIQRTQNDKSTTILQQENTQKNMVQRLVFFGGSFGVPEKLGSAPWCTCDTCASPLQQFPPLAGWRRWRVHRLHLTHGRWLLW